MTMTADFWAKSSPLTDLGIESALIQLQEKVYQDNVSAGWHNNLDGTERTLEEQEAMFPTRIALCHSELSEALEGYRKSLMDDHLPSRPMAEVELADTVIRIFDLAGAMRYDLAGAIFYKLAYNKKRSDHKLENRNKPNGKKF